MTRKLVVMALCAGLMASPGLAQQAPTDAVRTEDIPVDERIFREDWNETPFDTSYFSYSDEQLRERWTHLSRGLSSSVAPVPFPDADFLRSQFEKYPQLKEGMENFDGDYQRLEDRLLDCWRDFFAGRFQDGWHKGKQLGAMGELPALLSQLIYAMYLAEQQSVKNMLLQDIVHSADTYFDQYAHYAQEAANDNEVASLVAAMHLVRTYALARIAEEAPIPVITARGYIRKIQEGTNALLEVAPDQPLGMAFEAAVDAGIMRRMGKFTGRLTYDARLTTVEERFDQALDKGGDIPIINYEYGNALVYMNRKRDINTAMRYMEKATRIRPSFAMDALDAMYAYKRLRELRLYALNYRSFRDFEHDRRRYADVTDHNLTSVLTPPLDMNRLKNPEQHQLAGRR